MWTKRLLLSISLLSLIRGVKSQPTTDSAPAGYKPICSSVTEKEKCKYFMSVSARLQSGRTEVVCVYLECSESIDLFVTFEYRSENITVFNVASISSTFFECKTLSVPKVAKTELAFITFTITGQTVDIRRRRTVACQPLSEACFMQIEKGIFKPGDTMRSRLFCLDSNLKSTNLNCTKVYFVEPTGARIAQIEAPRSNHGFVEVIFNISDDAATGSYSIDCIRDTGETINQYVSVQRYVLPRYDTTFDCPSALSVLDQTAELAVTAQYVFQKPFSGTVIGECCRNKAYTYGRPGNCLRSLENICVKFTGEVVSGNYTKCLDLNAFHLQLSEYDSSVQCTVTVKENGTGVLDTKTCYMYITSMPINLQIDYSAYYEYYRPCIGYPIALTLTNARGEPMVNEMIIIAVDGQDVKNVTTDDQGRVECTIDTSPYNKRNITISARYINEDQCYAQNQWSRGFPQPYNCISRDYPYAEMKVNRFFSKSNNFLQIKRIREKLTCNKTYSMEVQYKVTEAGKGATEMSFFYWAKATADNVAHGQRQVVLNSNGRGIFFIDLYIYYLFAYTFQFLVVGVVDGEMISDMVTLSVESCFENQVALAFKQSVVAPGSVVQQEITATPGSVCGIRAFDASLSILSSNGELTADSIFSQLSNLQYGYKVDVYDLEDPAPLCEIPEEVILNGRYYTPESSATDGDTFKMMFQFGQFIDTDLVMRKPNFCGKEDFFVFNDPCSPIVFDRGVAFAKSSEAAGAGSMKTVRFLLFETFGWDLVSIGPDGKATVNSTTPDTITTWHGSVVCLSETDGVGLPNQTATVITILFIFAELTVPQICTRGEELFAVVTAVNNLEKCVKVNITIAVSDGSEVRPVTAADGAQPCICNGERVSVQWILKIKAVGKLNISAKVSTTHISDSCDGPNDESQPSRSDELIKQIESKAEGIIQEVTVSRLQNVNGTTKQFEVTVPKPDHYVNDSLHIFLTVASSPMSLVAEHFADVLDLPDGCCEQSMAKMFIVYHVRDYLRSTGQLDDKVDESLKAYLSYGYGRQMSCRRFDGDYSVFRNSDVFSSWLLVLIFYLFELLSDIIYIDKSNIQEQPLIILQRQQNLTTGCFSPIGSSFTIQDDYHKDIAFTANVVARLEGASYSIVEPMLEGALKCLHNADLPSLDTYTLSWVCYAAARAKQASLWENCHPIVIARAITQDGAVHWEQENQPPRQPHYMMPFMYYPVDIETTALMMLALMSSPISDPDHDIVAQAASWLCKIQGSTGAFGTSQSSVMATEAMTAYGKQTYVKNININVLVTLDGNEVARITINENNSMLVQKQELPKVFGTYTVTTTGTGSAPVQMSIRYNIEAISEGGPFSLTATTQTESCTEGVAPLITIIVCASYIGPRMKTGMILIDVTILTGYSADPPSLEKLLRDKKISEYGIKENHVHLYLEFMARNQEICVSFQAYMDQRVSSYQNGSVTIISYYGAVTESGYTILKYPCASVG